MKTNEISQKRYWLCSNYITHSDEIIASKEQPKMIYKGGVFWSCSVSYNTLNDLLSRSKALSYPCTECGGIIKANYDEGIVLRLKHFKVCHTCLHWIDILSKINDIRIIIVKGNAYWFESLVENPSKYQFLGFGGSHFYIKRNDGKLLHTNNLWHNGEIPERFHDRLTDNAVFLSKTEYEEELIKQHHHTKL